MKNVWRERRLLRKAIVIGDWVFWDKGKLGVSQMNYLISVFGSEPLQVMSVPYTFGHSWLVDVGRYYHKVTETNPDNLIKVGMKWPT